MKRREDLEELMDAPECSPRELQRALRFLEFLNRWTLVRWMLGQEVKHSKRVLDVATGGGDIPAYLCRNGIAGFAVGLDLGTTALALAQERAPAVPLVCADARNMPFVDKAFDIAICHLFFHHLDEKGFTQVLREMDRVSERVIVVDLLRSRWLFWVIRALTWFSGGISRHDGPVSVQRSYSLGEVEALVRGSGVRAKVTRRNPGRWCIRSLPGNNVPTTT